MASSRLGCATAFPAEVARFLLVEPEEVRRMVGQDKLPAIQVPLKKRKVLRIYLPDFHRWLVARSTEPGALRNYEDFLRRFDDTARQQQDDGKAPTDGDEA